MGQHMKRICTICARGGSKGLPGKNLRELAGKPLIAHSIAQAQEARIFDEIAISSDSEEILQAAESWGPGHLIRRPAEMADDTASKLPAIRHCVAAVEDVSGITFETIVDIDVTSPLRTADDIRGAVSLMESKGVTNVITGAPARKNPYFNMVQQLPDGYVDLCIRPDGGRLDRRQDCPPVFDMNAAVYVWQRHAFFNHMDVFYPDTLLYEMPDERSHDIDTPVDFQFVDLLMRQGD
jgi:N-acylneuraminate cytidylyltransferase/CMP-N,N'-diacetyllegionaminic acid synthase